MGMEVKEWLRGPSGRSLWWYLSGQLKFRGSDTAAEPAATPQTCR